MLPQENNPPRVSVLMGNYNGERFLVEAIESVLSQSFTDFEFIIVDDGSSDKSASLLASYAKKDKRIRAFYLAKNRGLARALNYGLGFARGEYVARMDSDDLCHRDRLLKQVSYLDKHKEIQLLGCDFHSIDEKGSFCSAAYARGVRSPVFISFGRNRIAKDILLNRYSVQHPTIVCRRSCFVSLGGYRDAVFVGEDIDFYHRLVILHGAALDNLSKKLYYFRYHGNSMTASVSQSIHIVIGCATLLSSEFRRRGFWDPLEESPSSDCRSLHFRGIPSFLYLQDSIIFLPSYYSREGLYSLLRVVIILRRFGLKDFHDISLLNNFGMTMDKQIYFYTFFCKLCFSLQKFRAGFLYFRYIISLYHCVSFFVILSSFFTIIYYFLQMPIVRFINFTKHRSECHLFLSRSLVFTNCWHYGMKHFLIAFCYNPFYMTRFFVIRFYIHSLRIMHVLYRKLRI